MVGLGPGNIMLNADPASPKGHSPLISAHVCCGQTAECIKMPLGLSVLSRLPVTLVYCGQTVRWIKIKLGMQVGLGPGHIVLDGTHLPIYHLPYLRTYGGRVDGLPPYLRR